MSGRGKEWTPEEDAYLRDNYRRQSYDEMGAAIGRAPGGVQNRCFALQLYSKKWSGADVEYLQESWGKASIPEIAKKLNRSINAIKLKAGRLGMGRHLHSGDLITFVQLCEALGKKNSYSWLRDKWARYGFPFRRKKSIKEKYLMVSIEDFWKWAERHQDIIDFSDFEEYAIGKEPVWAKEKRHMDFEKRRNNKPWTQQEDDRLIHMLRAQRYSLDEIAADLDRKEGAIRRRIHDLGIKDRPVRNPGKWWTEEEIAIMRKMHSEGRAWEDIGATLGRTASACRGRYERLLNPDSYTKEAVENKRALKGYFQRRQCANYSAATGCRLRGTDCDACTEYRRRAPEESYATGWISSKAGHDGQARVMEGGT